MKKNWMIANFVLLAMLLVIVSMSPVSAKSDPTTTCTSGFNGTDIAVRTIGPAPFLAFVATPSVPVVNRYPITSGPGPGACAFGPPFAISLGPGISSSWGVTLSPGAAGALFVTAGPSSFSVNQILRISSPASVAPGPLIVFFSPPGFHNFRSLAHINSILYAADDGTGTIYRFDLSVAPCTSGPFPVLFPGSCVSTLAGVGGVPGVFGLVPNPSGALDDLYATSNGGFNVQHVTTSGAITLPSSFSSFPEGIGASGPTFTSLCTSTVTGCLYVAAGGVIHVYDLDLQTFTTTFGSLISASHGVTFWTGGVYVTDSIAFSIFKIA